MYIVNQIIEWKFENTTRYERILWNSQNGKYFYVIDINGNDMAFIRTLEEIELCISDGRAKILEDDPFFKYYTDEELSTAQTKFVKTAWDLISSLVNQEPQIYMSKKRKKLIEDVIKANKVSKTTIFNYLKRFWKYGKTKLALTPEFINCGAPGKQRNANIDNAKRGRPRSKKEINGEGINVTNEIKEIFQKSINKFYYTRAKNSLKLAYELMLKEYFTNESGILVESNQIPTLEQYRYWHSKQRNVKKEIISRNSIRKYEQEYKSIIGTASENIFAPASQYQIDSTLFDVYLVSSFDRNKTIGRPVFYTVLDVYSRMIVSVYVTVEGPSHIANTMCLYNAFSKKVDFCQRYGIEITEDQWPVHYVPESILGDRGELLAKKTESMITNLNIKVQNTAPFKAEFKPIVEKYFNLLNIKVKSLVPGKIDTEYRKRGDRDYRLDASLNINEFYQIIIKCILFYNNEYVLQNYLQEPAMISDKIKMIPIEIWKWGIKNKAGRLRQIEQDALKIALLPRATAKVTPKGLKFQTLYYSSASLLKAGIFDEARYKGHWSINIIYDPRCLDFIYYKLDDQNTYDKARLLDYQEAFFKKSEEEISDIINEQKVALKELEHDELQSKVNLYAEIQEIVKNANKEAELAKDPEISDSRKIKDIRENRSNERDHLREKEVFDIEIEKKNTVVPIKRSYQHENPELDLIRKKQKERLRKDD